MTFNKCSINGIIYGTQEETHYGRSEDMIKVHFTVNTSTLKVSSIVTVQAFCVCTICVRLLDVHGKTNAFCCHQELQ